jgi:geranylgeranyl pyrophosphate synthase
MLQERVDDLVGEVDQKLRNIVLTDIDLLEEASHHIIDSGGKRVRPRLVFLSYLAAGGENVDDIVALASAVELVHTATLVHDDINDHSLTRRGQISVHARWGRTFALLTGDYLFTKVYELMAPYGSEYNIIMADACVKLVEGETQQAAAAKAGSLDQETYRSIIGRKTASLFEAGARMGAMLGNGNAVLVEAMGNYAYNLGLAFQIVDDVLDIVGDPEAMGKPVGSDVLQGTGAVMAQNGRKDADIGVVSEADPIKKLMNQIRESGAVDIALAQADERANRARQALQQVPASPARDQLESLIDLVLAREQ